MINDLVKIRFKFVLCLQLFSLFFRCILFHLLYLSPGSRMWPIRPKVWPLLLLKVSYTILRQLKWLFYKNYTRKTLSTSNLSSQMKVGSECCHFRRVSSTKNVIWVHFCRVNKKENRKKVVLNCKNQIFTSDVGIAIILLSCLLYIWHLWSNLPWRIKNKVCDSLSCM